MGVSLGVSPQADFRSEIGRFFNYRGLFSEKNVLSVGVSLGVSEPHKQIYQQAHQNLISLKSLPALLKPVLKEDSFRAFWLPGPLGEPGQLSVKLSVGVSLGMSEPPN